MLAPGMQVDRYELVCPVGEGGMAQVWVARQKGKHGFEKLFAFKAIHSRFAEDTVFRSMFLEEARIAASIDHPNVAQVFDLGEAELMLYLVMEYIDGESLGALMIAASKRTGAAATVPVPVALRIVADVCAGLHAAHRLVDATGFLRGVVHRDISPQNVLVSVRGDVKVIDFGIAHAKDRIALDTQDGSVKGKLHYMAPEQARREPLGAYTDVFAAGATLYRMLSGHPPFDAGNDAATLQMLLSDTPPPPLPASVPPLVAAIVERAISRDPGERYATAFGMQTALEAAIVEEGYVPDVASWVLANLSERAVTRRKELASRTMSISADAAVVPRTSSPGIGVAEGSPVPPAPVPDASAAGMAPSFSFDLGPIPVKPASALPISLEPISADPVSPTLASMQSVAPSAVPVPEIIHIEVPKRPSAPEAPPRPPPPVPALDFSAPAQRKPPPPAAPAAAIARPLDDDDDDDKPSSSADAHAARGPGMMDVRALVARKASPAAYTPPPAAPPAASAPIATNGITSRAVRELDE